LGTAGRETNNADWLTWHRGGNKRLVRGWGIAEKRPAARRSLQEMEQMEFLQREKLSLYIDQGQ
jgi:hypothetical protein